MRHRLDDTFARLQQHAPDAYLLICAAAEYRVPVKARFWLGQLAWRGKSEQERTDVLQALATVRWLNRVWMNSAIAFSPYII